MHTNPTKTQAKRYILLTNRFVCIMGEKTKQLIIGEHKLTPESSGIRNNSDIKTATLVNIIAVNY